jgi:hypothetical protein
MNSDAQLQSGAAVSSSDLVRRLRAHIAMMAPHQKERHAGKLLIEATTEIRKLQTALGDLMPYVLEDYYPNCATPGYKAAVEAAKALTPNSMLNPNSDH